MPTVEAKTVLDVIIEKFRFHCTEAKKAAAQWGHRGSIGGIYADDLESLITAYESNLDELKRLREVVGKLPVTFDKKTIWTRMNVYIVRDSLSEETQYEIAPGAPIIEAGIVCLTLSDEDEDGGVTLVRTVDGDEFNIHWNWLHSTRESAESAAKEKS